MAIIYLNRKKSKLSKKAKYDLLLYPFGLFAIYEPSSGCWTIYNRRRETVAWFTHTKDLFESVCICNIDDRFVAKRDDNYWIRFNLNTYDFNEIINLLKTYTLIDVGNGSYRYRETPDDMKQCQQCYRIKPRIEFSKKKKNKDGLEHYCKQCIQENKENKIKWEKERAERSLAEINEFRSIDGLKPLSYSLDDRDELNYFQGLYDDSGDWGNRNRMYDKCYRPCDMNYYISRFGTKNITGIKPDIDSMATSSLAYYSKYISKKNDV
jgi:hypothetical protein